jgi:transcriptional regulator with XRE-family HTH domain
MKVADRVAVAEAVSEGRNPTRERLTLRQLRERSGLSIKQLERITGIPRGTLSGIETGTRTPTPRELARLAEFYGVDLEGCRFVVLATFEVQA